jgi:secreted Zn-dependent insulinase-like peptidase
MIRESTITLRSAKADDLKPGKLTSKLKNLVFYKDRLDTSDYVSALKDIVLEDVLSFMHHLLRSVDLEIFVHGNLSNSSAFSLTESLEDKIFCHQDRSHFMDPRVCALPAGKNVQVCLDSLHEFDCN